MTPLHWKLGGLALVLLWELLRTKSGAGPTGTVDVGTPTVSGSGSDQFGGQDYGTALAPDAGGLLVSPVQEAIDRSNAAIAGYTVPPNPWGIE